MRRTGAFVKSKDRIGPLDAELPTIAWLGSQNPHRGHAMVGKFGPVKIEPVTRGKPDRGDGETPPGSQGPARRRIPFAFKES
jgi:hypothetical protein